MYSLHSSIPIRPRILHLHIDNSLLECGLFLLPSLLFQMGCYPLLCQHNEYKLYATLMLEILQFL